MNENEALPERVQFAGYDATSSEKLRSARSGIGWCALLFAVAAVVPSLIDGIRNHRWVSSASIFCAVSFVVNLLIYVRFTTRLKQLALLEIAPNQLPDPTSPSVTPPAGAGGAPSVAADH